MSSTRYIIKDRLERAANNLNKSAQYMAEVDTIFKAYGEAYGKYVELVESIGALIATAKDFIEKLNNTV